MKKMGLQPNPAPNVGVATKCVHELSLDTTVQSIDTKLAKRAAQGIATQKRLKPLYLHCENEVDILRALRWPSYELAKREKVDIILSLKHA